MTNLPETKAIELELEDGWLRIWFNTPENRNALSAQLTADLMATLDAVRDDRSVRGITLRGRGGIFCAGADLKGFNSQQSDDTKTDEEKYQAIWENNRGGGDMFDAVQNMPQVVVALVEGAAIAGGLGMACCCDVVAVTKDAKFSLTETAIGIVPAQIAPFVVARFGLNKARSLMMAASRFTGETAIENNLANYVVEDAAGLDAIEQEIIKGVKKCAPIANAETKQLLLKLPRLSRSEQMDEAAHAFARCFTSDDGREGILSFVEKRKPRWAT